jgi:hypothetical protein
MRIEWTVSKIIDRIARLAQRHHAAVRQFQLLFLIVDMHSAFALQAGNSQFLQLRAVDRVGEIEHFVVGKLGFFFRSAGVAGQPQEHRGGAAVALRRMAAAVL